MNNNQSLVNLLSQLLEFLNLTEDNHKKLIEENKLLREQNCKLEKQIEEMKAKVIFLEKFANTFTIEEKEEDDFSFESICKKLKDNYKNLDAYLKRDFVRMFDITNPEKLIIKGCLEFENLWDYALTCKNESRIIAFEEMRDIIYSLFQFRKAVFNSEWQEVKIGDKFDEEVFLMDSESNNQLGIIEEVILKGYIEDGKLIRKSLVKVK